MWIIIEVIKIYTTNSVTAVRVQLNELSLPEFSMQASIQILLQIMQRLVLLICNSIL